MVTCLDRLVHSDASIRPVGYNLSLNFKRRSQNEHSGTREYADSVRSAIFVAAYIALLVLAAAPTRAADYGTADEARAMLEKEVAAVKADKAHALDTFNKGEGGFKDRDLYVFCANASDGILTGASHDEGQTTARDFGQEGLSTRSRDDAEGYRRNDKGGYLLVAHVLAQTSRWKRLRFTRESETKCVESATTSEPLPLSGRPFASDDLLEKI